MEAEPVADYIFSSHAEFEIKRRGLNIETLQSVLSAPGQRMEVRPGRDVFQSKVADRKSKKTYLVRVFVDVDRHPPEVVTAYRTSKLSKYWKDEP